MSETILPVLGAADAEKFGHEVWNTAEQLAQRITEQNKKGGVKCSLRIEARNPDGSLVEVVERDALTCKAFAQLTQQNIFAGVSGGATNITDTGGTSRSIAANSASTAPLVVAGTTGTAAVFADNKLGNETETVAGTVTAISSNTYTVTGTVTAGADRLYAEVGIRVTVATWAFLMCHDTFTGLNVSNTGTLAVTYTFTFT